MDILETAKLKKSANIQLTEAESTALAIFTSEKPVVIQEANEEALGRYVGLIQEIKTKVARLQYLVDSLEQDEDPDEIHWGHVGDLGKLNQDLDNIMQYLGGSDASS